MKLHLDRDAFGVLLEDIHSRTGYRTDVLEKDYYVVLILSELAEMQKRWFAGLLQRRHSAVQGIKDNQPLFRRYRPFS